MTDSKWLRAEAFDFSGIELDFKKRLWTRLMAIRDALYAKEHDGADGGAPG